MTAEKINKEARLLIVDDEMANVRFLEIVLRQAGYVQVFNTTNPFEARDLFVGLKPDIVLLDINMPHLDGFAVMQQLLQEMDGQLVPILVLTADATTATKHRALQAGAMDFLTKPLDEIEVLLRIRHLLENRFHHALLEEKVNERTEELEQAQLETLQRLAIAAEYRDDETGLHTKRVGKTARLIAETIGLPDYEVQLIRRAAPLHDIGKIGIADDILLKPGRLTPIEFEMMRLHTSIGAEILSKSTSPWLQIAETIALNHHERWDGTGYPASLKGEEIPLVGRIVAIADVFDALTHVRPYKSAWSVAASIAELKGNRGTQFDARLVDAFMTLPHDELI